MIVLSSIGPEFQQLLLLHRRQVPKSAKSKQPADLVRPVSTDATASYSQGISINKDMGYKPQEQTSLERYSTCLVQTPANQQC